MYFVYRTTNNTVGEKNSGKMYIGMCANASEPRRRGYLGSNPELRSDIKQFGRDHFTREILFETDDYDILCKAEIDQIKMFDAVDGPDYYNHMWGSEGHPPGEAHWNYGGSQSDDTKALIGAAQSGDKHHNWGKTTSDDVRMKLSTTLGDGRVRGAKHGRARQWTITLNGKTETFGCKRELAEAYDIATSSVGGIKRRCEKLDGPIESGKYEGYYIRMEKP